ncbi:hypothetical protein HDV06_004406, partial [Boothiomyces sp. JEL0866]
AVPGRTFPVEIFYTKQVEKDYVEAAFKTVLQIHKKEQGGDILVFLTGEEEIEETCRNLRIAGAEIEKEYGPLVPLPLYSNLSPSDQAKIFQKCEGRKVVVSTNIAETSLTIDGIVYVVDPGFSKQKVYHPRMRVESLLVSPISKASAQQRSGRAGRTRPGKCFRLYTEKVFHEELEEQTYPEILKSNIAGVVLQLKKIGVENLIKFDFMDPPGTYILNLAPETMMRALEMLFYFGAFDNQGNLTPYGSLMAEFPLDPQFSHSLMVSPKFNCAEELLSIVALLNVPPVFVRPKNNQRKADQAKSRFEHEHGDHLSLLNVYNSYVENDCNSRWCFDNFLNARNLRQAVNVRSQLKRYLAQHGLGTSNTGNYDQLSKNIRKALCAGFYMHVAHAGKTGAYTVVKDDLKVVLHPSTCLRGKDEWVMYHEFVLTSKQYIRTCSVIEPAWLLELAPAYYAFSNFPDCDAKRALLRISKKRNNKKK